MEGLIYPGTVINAFVHATITPCQSHEICKNPQSLFRKCLSSSVCYIKVRILELDFGIHNF